MVNEQMTLPIPPATSVQQGRLRTWWIPTVTVVVGVVLAAVYVDSYIAYLATSWVIFGLLGLSLDLVWGRGGMLSLGQTAFYGLGGYVGSIAAINFSTITGNTLIWSLPFGATAGAVAAAFVGWFIFYARMGPLQSTVLTYTLILIIWTISLSFNTRIGDAVVGGDNGLSNIPGMILGFGSAAETFEPNAMLIAVIIIAAAIYLLIQSLMRSPFGLVIDCIRLDPEKTELLGYDIRKFQLVLFTVSGAIAGIGGALFGAWSNYLHPSIFSVQEVLLVPIYVLVGGLGTLAGPFIGALAVGTLSFWLGGGAVGGQATLILGACLIAMVLFLRKGLIGGVFSLFALFNKLPDLDADVEPEFGVNVDFDLLRQLQTAGSNDAEVVLETRDALKSFGGVTPVNHVSQTFEPGKVRCVIGPNGAGKSSYLKTCTGAYKLDAGQILLAGKDMTTVDPFQRVNLGLGIKMQKAQVFDELDVRQNLWIASCITPRSCKSRATATASKTSAAQASWPNRQSTRRSIKK